MKLIGLIAVMLALTAFRWCARPQLWRAALVAALCASLPGIISTVSAAPPLDPSFTEVVKVSTNPGNSNHPQIAGKDDQLFTVWNDGANVVYRRITIVGGQAIPNVTVNITNFGPNVLYRNRGDASSSTYPARITRLFTQIFGPLFSVPLSAMVVRLSMSDAWCNMLYA